MKLADSSIDLVFALGQLLDPHLQHLKLHEANGPAFQLSVTFQHGDGSPSDAELGGDFDPLSSEIAGEMSEHVFGDRVVGWYVCYRCFPQRFGRQHFKILNEGR